MTEGVGVLVQDLGGGVALDALGLLVITIVVAMFFIGLIQTGSGVASAAKRLKNRGQDQDRW